MTASNTNVVIAGLGGQGILKASDILAEAAFRAGHNVKKTELHGMSQRGGFVTSDVRFGLRILSPMVPPGEADYLVLLEPAQLEPARPRLRADGVLLSAGDIDLDSLPMARAYNVAMLGWLDTFLHLPSEAWLAAIRAVLPEPLHEANVAAFLLGQGF